MKCEYPKELSSSSVEPMALKISSSFSITSPVSIFDVPASPCLLNISEICFEGVVSVFPSDLQSILVIYGY